MSAKKNFKNFQKFQSTPITLSPTRLPNTDEELTPATHRVSTYALPNPFQLETVSTQIDDNIEEEHSFIKETTKASASRRRPAFGFEEKEQRK